MGFVNEFIPEEDIEKYGIKAIDEKVLMGCTSTRDWTIDRERNIYLRIVARGRGGSEPEFRNETIWTFYWDDELIYLRLNLIECGGDDEQGWVHWHLVSHISKDDSLDHFKDRRVDFINDLKKALSVHKFCGAYSKNYSKYRVILES